MLVNGKWEKAWHPVQAKDSTGRFVRQGAQFRNWITPDGSAGPTGKAGFRAEPDRYHLYVALICPWASRTLMARALKGLVGMIPVSVVEPFLGDQGWAFGDYPGAGKDPVNGARYIHDLYTRASPHYTGRATVPVLWDKVGNTIVSNESADIVRMFNTAFDHLGATGPDLYPEALRPAIDQLGSDLYERLNNGVYKAGFASSQQAYDEAVTAVFAALGELEVRLDDGRSFLFGEHINEADIRLLVTLVRFDAAYHGLFKCNLARVADYPNLSRYIGRMMGEPGIAATVNMDHIKAGYYSIQALNPSRIVPAGPVLEWLR